MDKMICENCGGKLIRQQGSTMKCDSCGTEFLPESASEKEQLLLNAETCVRIGDFAQARSVCNQLISKFPDDYRVWWATVISETNNMTDFSAIIRDGCPFSVSDLNEYQAYQNFLRLAPPDRAAEKAAEFTHRLHESLSKSRNATTKHGLSERHAALEARQASLAAKQMEYRAWKGEKDKKKRKIYIASSISIVLSILIIIIPDAPLLLLFLTMACPVAGTVWIVAQNYDHYTRGRELGLKNAIAREHQNIEAIKNDIKNIQSRQNMFSDN